jgi:hypothetical protein
VIDAPTIAALAAFITALASLVSSIRNGGKLASVDERLNGKLDRWMKEVKAASFAAGRKAQKDDPEQPSGHTISAPIKALEKPRNQP